MLPRRYLASLALVLALAGSSLAQNVDLSEGPLVDNFFRVDMVMKLSGQTRVQQAGKFVEQTVGAEAQHEYLEKIMQVNDGIVDKTVRTYRRPRRISSSAAIQSTPQVSGPRRTLLVSQRVHGQNVTYCPHGSLTREELELTEHFNTSGPHRTAPRQRGQGRRIVDRLQDRRPDPVCPGRTRRS